MHVPQIREGETISIEQAQALVRSIREAPALEPTLEETRRIFNSMPILEVKLACFERMMGFHFREKSIQWCLERAVSQLKRDNATLAVPMLRGLLFHIACDNPDEIRRVIVPLTRFCVSQMQYLSRVKRGMTALIGFFRHHPELYQRPQIRKSVRRVLRKFLTVHCSNPLGFSEADARLCCQVFQLIGALGDVSFLDVLRRGIPEVSSSAFRRKQCGAFDEVIVAEGTRLWAISMLEQIQAGQQEA